MRAPESMASDETHVYSFTDVEAIKEKRGVE